MSGAVKLSAINSQPSTVSESLFRSAFAQKLGDIEVHKIGVVKNDRFDRALYFVALMAVRGDNMQHFARNAVLVSERNATERVAHLLSEFALDHISRRVLIVFQRLAHIGQQRPGDEVIALNGDAAAKGLLEDIGDGDALPCS